ncbi:phage tail protein [Acinetobacter baumannii]|uniref:phage tail protein n=1 Tax=Acinetobacter baumannii TaxID=470 RepID=UPI00207B5421|nr:phage tail protein [Acinetobacter baumannii]
MAAQYFSVFTEQGLALLRESIQNGTKLGITRMSFGDGGGSLPVPDSSVTRLVNEVYQTSLNSLAPDPNNSNWLRAEAVISSAVGGFNIRELGLWSDDILVAYSNYPPTYKPNPSDGTARIMTFRMVLQIDNTANFELKIDADIVMATIRTVEEAKQQAIEHAENLVKHQVSYVDDLDDFLTPSTGQVVYVKDVGDFEFDGDNWVPKVRLDSSTKTVLGRFLDSKNLENVSIKDYGAVGNGTLIPISDWWTIGSVYYRGYTDLASVKNDYPFVTSATDSVDWAATQKCVNMKVNVYAPAGNYILSRSVHTPHSGSPNRVDSCGKLFGDGVSTNFSRENAVPMTTSTTGEISVSDINNNESCFSLHGSYFHLKNFSISRSPIGIYFGQDLTKSELSACYRNVIKDLIIRNVGTGVLFDAAYGNHYNTMRNIHFVQCQIDCLMRNSPRGGTISNNNRNHFHEIRSNRSIIGLWIKSADTTRIVEWDGEGCGEKPTNNSFPTPEGLPLLPDGITPLKTCVHLFEGVGQLQSVINCKMEGNEIELYNKQFGNMFLYNGYHEAEVEIEDKGKKVYMPEKPRSFISQHTFCSNKIVEILNVNRHSFPGFTNAGLYFVGDTGPRNVTGSSTLKESLEAKPYKKEFIESLGNVPASSVHPISIWENIDASSSATFKILIVGNAQANNISFASELLVSALRSSTRALSRYHMVEQVGIRATGQGAGDTGKITAQLELGGDTTRDLMLKLTMPAYEMSNVTIFVERVVTF